MDNLEMELSKILPGGTLRNTTRRNFGYSSVPPELNYFGLSWFCFYPPSSYPFTANTPNEALLLYLILLQHTSFLQENLMTSLELACLKIQLNCHFKFDRTMFFHGKQIFLSKTVLRKTQRKILISYGRTSPHGFFSVKQKQ